MNVISTRFTNAGQSLTLTRVSELRLGNGRPRKFRTTLHRDSHANQSYAKVEVWTDAGWTNVVYVPGNNAEVEALETSYAHKVADKTARVEAQFNAYADALELEAQAVAA